MERKDVAAWNYTCQVSIYRNLQGFRPGLFLERKEAHVTLSV